jgi:hypothetical protein
MKKSIVQHVNMNPPYPGASYTDCTLLVEGYEIRFGVGEVKPGETGRKVMNGDLVPGPWAYVYGQATVIDNFGGTAREMEEKRERGCVVEARLGDVVEINGRKYRIVKGADRHYVGLELVTRKTRKAA